jgi:peptidoglycan/LPS O-acetylase OafA/YrhL
MQLVLSSRYTKARLGKAWVSQFYKARYFRLLPTYLLGSLIVLAAGVFQPASAPFSTWRYVWGLPATAMNVLFSAYLCFTNVTMFFQDATVFLAVHNGLVHWSSNFWKSDLPLWEGLTIPQAWSLGIEINFYFLAPYLLRLRSQWLFIGSLCCLTLKVITVLALHLGDPWIYRFFPFELGYFLLGALAFRYRHLLDGPALKRMAKYCVYPCIIVFTAARVPGHLATFVYPIALACFVPLLFRMTSGHKIDRWVGELSYPFYIFHYVCLAFAGAIAAKWLHTSEDSIPWIALFLTLTLSVIALTLETHFIEPWRGRFAAPLIKIKPADDASRTTHA